MERIPILKGCIWGPMESPRLGKTVWVNPLPVGYKLCSFNCLYCRLGASDTVAADITPYLRDLPSANKILTELERTLKRGADFDTLALSGNGEPTLHPDFPKLVYGTRRLLKQYKQDKTFALLSNSSTLVRREIRELVGEFDLSIFKLDAGRSEIFQRVNRPDPGLVFEDMVEELRKLGSRIHLQTVFVVGPRGNMDSNDIKLWMRTIMGIKPKVVEIYSINREYPGMGIEMVPLVILEELARKAQRNTGLEVVAYGNWK
ncbi:radical SAM protein [candidate division WOR-3 bacterium]|nr:radical SAM protein [candidate division WOR-3 bacterium]